MAGNPIPMLSSRLLDRLNFNGNSSKYTGGFRPQRNMWFQDIRAPSGYEYYGPAWASWPIRGVLLDRKYTCADRIQCGYACRDPRLLDSIFGQCTGRCYNPPDGSGWYGYHCSSDSGFESLSYLDSCSDCGGRGFSCRQCCQQLAPLGFHNHNRRNSKSSSFNSGKCILNYYGCTLDSDTASGGTYPRTSAHIRNQISEEAEAIPAKAHISLSPDEYPDRAGILQREIIVSSSKSQKF